MKKTFYEIVIAFNTAGLILNCMYSGTAFAKDLVVPGVFFALMGLLNIFTIEYAKKKKSALPTEKQ